MFAGLFNNFVYNDGLAYGYVHCEYDDCIFSYCLTFDGGVVEGGWCICRRQILAYWKISSDGKFIPENVSSGIFALKFRKPGLLA